MVYSQKKSKHPQEQGGRGKWYRSRAWLRIRRGAGCMEKTFMKRKKK